MINSTSDTRLHLPLAEPSLDENNEIHNMVEL